MPTQVAELRLTVVDAVAVTAFDEPRVQGPAEPDPRRLVVGRGRPAVDGARAVPQGQVRRGPVRRGRQREWIGVRELAGAGSREPLARRFEVRGPVVAGIPGS